MINYLKKLWEVFFPKKKPAAKKRTSPISSYKGRKGEKYMSAAMKKHFNAVLIDWREHLKEEMQKTFDHLKNKGESYADHFLSPFVKMHMQLVLVVMMKVVE